jgi:hypothetical protein
MNIIHLLLSKFLLIVGANYTKKEKDRIDCEMQRTKVSPSCAQSRASISFDEYSILASLLLNQYTGCNEVP